MEISNTENVPEVGIKYKGYKNAKGTCIAPPVFLQASSLVALYSHLDFY